MHVDEGKKYIDISCTEADSTTKTYEPIRVIKAFGGTTPAVSKFFYTHLLKALKISREDEQQSIFEEICRRIREEYGTVFLDSGNDADESTDNTDE